MGDRVRQAGSSKRLDVSASLVKENTSLLVAFPRRKEKRQGNGRWGSPRGRPVGCKNVDTKLYE